MVMGLNNYALFQMFIIVFIVIFSYKYSNKNWKYLIYGLISVIANILIQGVCYLYKARFIDFANLNQLNKFITGIDYYIVMALIIIAKEIYKRKRREV